EGEHVSGAGLFDLPEKKGNACDLDPANRKDHVTGPEVASSSGRIRENLLKQDTAVVGEFLAVPHLPGYRRELRSKQDPPAQFAVRLEQAGNRQGTLAPGEFLLEIDLRGPVEVASVVDMDLAVRQVKDRRVRGGLLGGRLEE